MNARTTRSSARRPARKRVIDAARRSLHPPILDPQRRRILVAGRHDVDQPFRQDVAVRAKIERQGGKLLGIDFLDAAPQGRALLGIALELDGIDELIHLAVVEAAGVLPALSLGSGP